MAGVNIDLTGIASDVTLDGTAGFPVGITVPANQVSLTGSGTCFPYIYVVDSGNNRIQAFREDGTLAFTFGSYGTGDGQFDKPYAIATDGEYLYVTDSGNARIQKFTMKGVYVAQGGSGGSGDGQFDNPMGIAVDNIIAWVVDNNNNRIQAWCKVTMTFLYSFGSFGSGVNEFNEPTDCTTDDLYLYIDDTGNSRIVTLVKPTSYESNCELPCLEMEGEGYIRALYGDLVLPCLELEAYGTVHPVMTADLVLPALDIEASGVVNPVMTADLVLPCLDIEAQAYVGSNMTADLVLPALELEATGISDSIMTADLILPALELEAYGEVTPATVTYYAFSINPTNAALAEYTNYAFNSFAFFNGTYLGANSNGIYELEGSKDAGTAIDAEVLSGEVDTYQGSESMPSVKKKTGEAWLNYETNGGELRYVLEGDKDGTIYYPINSERVKFARGLRSRYFKHGIKNVHGAYFKLKHIRVKAEPMLQRTR